METITVLKVSYLSLQPIYNPINMRPIEWKVNSTESDVLLRARHSIVAYMAGSVNKFDGTLRVVQNKVEFDAVLGDVVTYCTITKAVFEVMGNINRNELGLQYITFKEKGGLSIGYGIALVATFEFTT